MARYTIAYGGIWRCAVSSIAETSKRELPSSELMSASAGCGHAVAFARGRLVPCTKSLRDRLLPDGPSIIRRERFVGSGGSILS